MLYSEEPRNQHQHENNLERTYLLGIYINPLGISKIDVKAVICISFVGGKQGIGIPWTSLMTGQGITSAGGAWIGCQQFIPHSPSCWLPIPTTCPLLMQSRSSSQEWPASTSIMTAIDKDRYQNCASCSKFFKQVDLALGLKLKGQPLSSEVVSLFLKMGWNSSEIFQGTKAYYISEQVAIFSSISVGFQSNQWATKHMGQEASVCHSEVHEWQGHWGYLPSFDFRCAIRSRFPLYLHFVDDCAHERLEKGSFSDSLNWYTCASGWWGVSRHFHYVPEILAAVFWTLPAGNHPLVWFYVVFLTLLLTDRSFRDDQRCLSKYGSYWHQYCQAVPYRLIPYVYWGLLDYELALLWAIINSNTVCVITRLQIELSLSTAILGVDRIGFLNELRLTQPSFGSPRNASERIEKWKRWRGVSSCSRWR